MKEFEKELKALMIKHEIGIDKSDEYGGDDQYMGTEYHFTKDGNDYYEEIGPLMIQLLKE